MDADEIKPIFSPYLFSQIFFLRVVLRFSVFRTFDKIRHFCFALTQCIQKMFSFNYSVFGRHQIYIKIKNFFRPKRKRFTKQQLFINYLCVYFFGPSRKKKTRKRENGTEWRARNENEILKEIITWIRSDLIANALTAKITLKAKTKEKQTQQQQQRKKRTIQAASTMVAAMKYLMLSGKQHRKSNVFRMSKIQSAKIQPMRLLNSIYGLNGKETKTKPVTSDDDYNNNTEKKNSW